MNYADNQYRSDRRRENENRQEYKQDLSYKPLNRDTRGERYNNHGGYNAPHGPRLYRRDGRQEYPSQARERSYYDANSIGYREQSPRNPRERYDRRGYNEQPKYDRGNYQRHGVRGSHPYQNEEFEEKKNHEPTSISKEEQIETIQKRLKSIEALPLLNEIKIIGSQWGIKPKGFENVTAQRAKLSGLFPLPGYPRPVDFTKLEGAIKDRLSNSDDILNESSRISASDSRNARILIIKDIDFGKVNYLKIVEFIDDFLKKIDIEETSTKNIEMKRKTKDDRNLILEFKNNICATIVNALDGIKIPLNELSEASDLQSDENIKINIERPGEYVVQKSLVETEGDDEVIVSSIKDSSEKVTLLISLSLSESEILAEVNKIHPVQKLQLLREIGTKQSLGISFIEFSMNESGNKVSDTQKVIEELKTKEFIKNAFFSCLVPNRTSIQDGPVDFNTLKALARNENVSAHPKLRVIQLINIITAKDIVDEENYRFIEKDIKSELQKYGKVVSIKIPRPANDYTPGIIQFNEPGLGKIYIEFEDEESALNAIMGIAGRMYNDRTLICAFYNHSDYLNGLL